MQETKILAFDMDGTLTESAQLITGEMADVLKDISEHYSIIVISGTDIGEMKRMLEPAKDAISAYLGNNGMQIHLTHESDNALFNARPFPPASKIALAKAYRKVASEHNIEPESKDVWLDRGTQITISCIGRSAPLEKKKEFDAGRLKRREMVDHLEELLPYLHFEVGGTTSINVTAVEWDKRKGILNYLTRMQISMSHEPEKYVFYVGDELTIGGNDCAIAQAGIPFYETDSVEDTKNFLEALLRELEKNDESKRQGNLNI